MSKSTISRLILTLMVITGLTTTGCARWHNPPPSTKTQDSDLVFESYAAADNLLSQAPWLRDTRAPMLTATFVDVNSFEDSSALGRIVAEQISSRFAQQGFTMIQLTLRNNVFIKEQAGEFALSREIKNLSQVHNAAAVVVGTYAVGRRSVYVNARLIRAADSLVLAAYDYSLPMGPDTKALLARH